MEDGSSTVAVPEGSDRYQDSKRKTFVAWIAEMVPYLVYVFIIYVAGAYYFNGPRATVFHISGAPVSWGLLIIFTAGIVALVEIFKISRPGVDNSTEVYVMLGFATIQAVLIALSVAYPQKLWFMRTPENLMLMAVNAVQGFVALRVNARSLQRTISHESLGA